MSPPAGRAAISAQLGQGPAGEPLRRRVLAGLMGPVQRFGVVAQAVVEQRGSPLDEAQSHSLAAMQHVLGADLDQLAGVGFAARKGGKARLVVNSSRQPGGPVGKTPGIIA
jgi:hypothetical protein